MAAMLPMEAVADVLTAAGISPVKTSPVLPEPHECVFVNGSGGYAPQAEQSSNLYWRQPTVQVRIRSAPQQFESGRKLAHDVSEALIDAKPAGYDNLRLEASEADYIGDDDEDRHEWSINIMLEVLE